MLTVKMNLAKTLPKLYQTDTWGLFHWYIGQNVPNVAYISPISVPYIIKLKVIFQLFEFRKNLKKSDHPPQSKLAYIWNVDYFDFGADSPPFFTFSTIRDIFCLDCSPNEVKLFFCFFVIGFIFTKITVLEQKDFYGFANDAP